MIWLSPSKINLVNECPRCFWLDAHKIAPRPRGIMSSIPGAIDAVLKDHYDKARVTERGLPVELVGKIYGKLFPDQALIKKVRHWNGPHKIEFPELGVGARGALDDMFLENDGSNSPFDYKSKGSEPDVSYGEKYYQNQLDFYSLFMSKLGLRLSGKAYLAYYYLNGTNENAMGFDFNFSVKVLELTADPKRALELIKKAASILNCPVPSACPACEYCKFASSYNNKA